MKKTIFLILCILCSLGAMAQKKSITGVVTDASGESVIGASVVEVGTTNGVITDIDGKFTLMVDPNGKIKVSYVGYQPQVLDVKGKNSFNIKLKEDSEMLDEVVVTGYGGKQLRTKVTNSIGKVKEDVLQKGLFSNPAQALSGAVSGVRVLQTSGDPGATPTIILRGGTDYNGTGSPLVLVDGQVRGSLSDINPEDIESMEVLKDAGATAIYGARANNGVILVTTKRGKEGKGEVSVKAKVGINYYNNPYEFMNAGDYIYWMRTAYQRSGQIYKDSKGNWVGTADMNSLNNATPYGTGNLYFDPSTGAVLDGNKDVRAVWSTMKYTDDLAFLLKQGWQTMTDPVYGDQIIYKNTDPASFNLHTPSLSQDYNISISGGNDKGNYYAGIGYNNTDGTATGNWYKRLTFTFNADYKIKPWLTSSSSFNFADATWYGLSPGSRGEVEYFNRMLSLPPTFRGYNADGEMLLGPNSSDGNQSFNLSKFKRDNNTDKFTMVQSFDIKLMKGLNLKLTANWYFDEAKYEAFNQDYLSSPNNMNTSRSTSAEFDRTLNQTYNAVLNYDYQITKDHYLAAMLGFEYYDAYQKGFKTLIITTFRDETLEKEFLQDMIKLHVSGIVFTMMPQCPPFLEKIAKKYPVIVIGDKTTDIDLNVIETSNYTAGVLIAEHLYELGHRNIAFLTTTIGKSLSLAMRYQRLKAIQNTYKKLCMNEPYNIIVKEAKIDPELERKNIFLEHGVGYQLCNECLDDRNLANLTAFIGNNDMVSYGIMDAILKKGYQIPDDFSVCGFDNDFASSLLPISLTTVEHYMEDKGKKAFNMIYEKIQEKDDFFVQDDKCVIRIEYKSKLISRDSTNVARTRKNINL